MMRTKLLAAMTAGALTLPLTGLTASATAQTDDAATLAENVPSAVEELVAGLQAAIDVLAATQSTVETADALGEALAAAGNVLVDGTEQFGPLGLAFTVVDDSAQQVLRRYLEAIDDPSTAAELLDPADVATLLANLPAAVDGLVHGDDFADGLAVALAELLKGNLTFGPGFEGIGAPAFLGNTFNGTGVALTTLIRGTNLEPIAIPVAVVLLTVVVGGADAIQQLEDALAPAFEALAPVTGPVITALEGL